MAIGRTLAVLAIVALAACATPVKPPAEARQALASTGKLRVAINFGNTALARRDAAGEPSGIAIDLGREVARRLDVPFVAVGYPNAAKLVEGASAGEWDLGFAAIDPARAGTMRFTAPYMEVLNTYLVPDASPIRTVADADRPGMRIGVGEKNAADLFLTRNLKSAQLVRVADNVAAGEALLRSGKIDALAGNRAGLQDIRDRIGGHRIVEGRYNTVDHAIAVPHAQGAGLGYLEAFVREAKDTGAIARAIERNGVRGVEVAPLGRTP
jgi:polar amino acid transport system substrate-binding protein